MGNKIRVYMAARYSRLDELNQYARELEALGGYKVRAVWLSGSHRADDEHLTTDLAVKFAVDDLNDVDAADLVIVFTEKPRSSVSRGGRHVEAGYAMGRGTDVVAIGPIENVFYSLCERYETWEDFMAHERALVALSAVERSRE